MSHVAAVVVSHEPEPELEPCLRALAPQVDELVVVANLAGPRALPPGARLLENEQPLGLSANLNRGIAETTAPFVVVANPDTEAGDGAVATLLEFTRSKPRCGVAGPELRYSDGSWQPSLRRFPTVSGTIVRRTPLRLLFPPE